MHNMFGAIVSIALLAASGWAVAQTPVDEAQVRALAANWEQAWNQHDMKALASLLTEDADFVNVAGHHWKGRPEIEARHLERLNQFKDSVWTLGTMTVEFLKPDVALAHLDWRLKGDTDPDGTARKPRSGVFTWLVLKRDGQWQIRAAQNTNVVSQPPIGSK